MSVALTPPGFRASIESDEEIQLHVRCRLLRLYAQRPAVRCLRLLSFSVIP